VKRFLLWRQSVYRIPSANYLFTVGFMQCIEPSYSSLYGWWMIKVLQPLADGCRTAETLWICFPSIGDPPGSLADHVYDDNMQRVMPWCIYSYDIYPMHYTTIQPAWCRHADLMSHRPANGVRKYGITVVCVLSLDDSHNVCDAACCHSIQWRHRAAIGRVATQSAGLIFLLLATLVTK